MTCMKSLLKPKNVDSNLKIFTKVSKDDFSQHFFLSLLVDNLGNFYSTFPNFSQENLSKSRNDDFKLRKSLLKLRKGEVR